MSYYHTCPHCGAHLDPGEACDCFESRYARLTPENRIQFETMVDRLLEEQNTAASTANTDGGGSEHGDCPVPSYHT